MTLKIRPETPGDVAAIDEVNRTAFGRDDEARLVNALRDGGYARLSHVAEVDGKLVGHVLFSELPIVADDGRKTAALSLAPMAVSPDFQRSGIGTKLLTTAIAQCKTDGHQIVVVLGHPEYYPRFGFSSELAKNLACPLEVPADAWMALELAPGALRGVAGRVAYAPPFGL